jgi:glycyl-radical enzyme activating protein
LEELKTAYYFHLEKAISNWQRYWNLVMSAHKQVVNNYFAAALTKNCIEKGKSLDDGGAIINNTPTTLSSGMVNVANCFAGVETLLNNKLCTMKELREAIAHDWKGYEHLHKAALSAPKWGNNDDSVDKHCVELFNEYCKLVEQQANYLGEPYDPSMLAISTFVPFGKASGASPDGRHKGEPLADGVTSPMPNTDKSGVFSVLKSSQKIDHTKIRGGLLNLKFHPVTLRGQSGSEKLISLIKTYFQKNAFQVQFNVVDSNVLKDAQKHPEKYRDLIVRVAGFSAVFVELSEAVQNEVIARTEQFLPGGAYYNLDSQESTGLSYENEEAYVCDIQDFTVQDGPGIRSTVFLQGCPLSCKWCCNPETQSTLPQYLIDPKLCDGCGKCRELGATIEEKSGKKLAYFKSKQERVPLPTDEDICPNKAIKVSSKKYTAKELFEKLKKNLDIYQISNGGITLSGGEALLHPKFVHEFIGLAKSSGIRIGVETCGMWTLTPLIQDILKAFDFIYYDVKAFTNTVHIQYTGKSNSLILQNLRQISIDHKDKIIISIPIIPGVNNNSSEISKIAAYANELGIKKLRLLPYHALGKGKYEKLNKSYHFSDDMKVDDAELKILLENVKQMGINNVFIE